MRMAESLFAGGLKKIRLHAIRNKIVSRRKHLNQK